MSIAKANHNSCCAIMIGAAKSGQKLPAYIIFAGKATRNGRVIKECQEPAKHGHAEDMVCLAQENGWMDEVSMLDWVEHFWKPCTNGIQGMKLLLIDKFSAHMTISARLSIANAGT